MAINPQHLRQHIIRPACEAIGLYSHAAENLLLGTACQESKCGTFLKQLGNGPALGIFQMEPATHDDHLDWLGHRPELDDAFMKHFEGIRPPHDMVFHLRYAAAMARIHYYRVKEALPEAGDIPAQARYWKKYYNTSKGAGTVEEYLANWRRFS